jgi:tripeptide aminopeptidase
MLIPYSIRKRDRIRFGKDETHGRLRSRKKQDPDKMRGEKIMIKNRDLTDRFIRYAKIDTQSDEDAAEQPTTAKQKNLAELLVRELEELGAEVDYDEEHCYVYAGIPAAGTKFRDRKALGLISHMDTSPAVSGADVKPRIIENYRGEDPILKTEEFPELKNHIGEDLIATDGTTLLGADDKAGVSEIMNLVQYFHDHPEEEHCEIRIAFTPDEETGRGTEHFDAARFRAKEGYTVDGGKFGVLEYECFNAAGAKVRFSGKNVHTGDAKNTMINACLLAMEFESMLPPAERPEHTEGYEGFYHLDRMSGNVEKAVLQYIIRDHDRSAFESRKQTFRDIADYMNRKYAAAGSGSGEAVTLEMHDQYFNMAEIIRCHMDLVSNVERVLRDMGEEAVIRPIRGGTDGSVLSFRGIPCPNLCTGGYNYHSRFEYASIQEMEKTAELLIRLVKMEE